MTDFFKQNTRLALAFSGGVDSAYLLWAAKHAGAEIRPYYVKTEFQPQFELDDALRLSKELNVPITVLKANPLGIEDIKNNPKNRCYYCKSLIFSTILNRAKADGFDTVIDGTNASDEAGDRPGMKALAEMKVLSPLRICGLTKDEIRARSKEAGLFTWNKPAYACLATRIPTGEIITKEKLETTEKSEKYLMDLGFSDFRVRQKNGEAILQLKKAQNDLFEEHKEAIFKDFERYYTSVSIDFETRG